MPKPPHDPSHSARHEAAPGSEGLAAPAPPLCGQDMQAGSPDSGPGGPATDDLHLRLCRLSSRHRSVLYLMLLGRSNRLIAAELNLAEYTVKDHVKVIMTRLGIRSRTQIIRELNSPAMRKFLVSLSPPMHHAHGEGDAKGAVAHRAITPRQLGLTVRQGSVLSFLLEGLPNKEIAARLGLRDNTVKEHVSEIFRRLGVGTRSELLSTMPDIVLAAHDRREILSGLLPVHR